MRQKQAEKPDELCNVNQTQMRKNISHKYQNEGVKREEVAGNIHTISVSTDSKTCTSKESGNGKGLFDSNKLLNNLCYAT